jgi:hypothetical protein
MHTNTVRIDYSKYSVHRGCHMVVGNCGRWVMVLLACSVHLHMMTHGAMDWVNQRVRAPSIASTVRRHNPHLTIHTTTTLPLESHTFWFAAIMLTICRENHSVAP